MPTVTVLAKAQLNHSPHDVILIELIEHPGPSVYREAPLVLVTWPLKATMCDLQRFPEMAAVAARLFATAATELAAIKARRKP
jgi:hypothetical protein